MTVRLRLMGRPTWDGVPLVGTRPQALLAALVLAPRGLTVAELVEQVWEDEPPAHPGKALQVLVSRVRSATSATTVALTETGYRLGLDAAEVDVLALGLTVAEAREALRSGDAPRAADLAEAARDWDEPTQDDASGPLTRLRSLATRTLDAADDLLGRALSRQGKHAEALPLLEAAARRWTDESEVLVDLLRSMAATGGPAVALGRYEAYRLDLAERLGVDPAPDLQRLHRELLAADDPVRTGLRYDSAGLLGRDQDLARLRSALAASRLVTVLGPGGIGKTSIAQVLARESLLPHVHVVELVGVGAGDDVVVAVGAALGVRGSVTARVPLTPAEQADVRSRLAQELDTGPTLLVLDNCEHVLEPVAALVAFLLATTSDLRVLATSRAPLRLAAERVVPLSQLSATDAGQLFAQRASATRPDAVLDDETVATVVDRLDGLPLAVELAAARVRTMTVAEVAAAIDDRFATLRSRDRSAPERHRTLEAVIAWSWDLLAPDEQRALAWLSVFQDGFDRAAAVALLGADGSDLVDSLVEQSLLVLVEDGGTARFRALETIREYAAAQLVRAGQLGDALDALHAWASELADRYADLVVADDQIRAVDALVREQNNLTDVLRHGLAGGDRPLVARLVALLGSLWTVTGDQPRIFAVSDAAVEALADWEVPDGLHRHAQDAAGVLMVHLSWMPGADFAGLRHLLVQGPPPTGTWGLVGWSVHVEQEPADPALRLAAAAAAHRDRPAVVGALLLWAALVSENAGDVDAARRHTDAALAGGALPPYVVATLHAELSQLAMAAGDHHAAARHAEVAWPLLRRLHSHTDAYSLQMATAIAPLREGEVDAAAALLDELGPPQGEDTQVGARMTWEIARAELALARGERDEALRGYDALVDMVVRAGFGSGSAPWLKLSAAAALVARARHGASDEDPRADELRDLVAADAGDSLWFTDLPLNGMALVALGAWVLRFGPQEQHRDGILLLALGHRWGYNRSIPVMAWEPLVDVADATEPGLVGRLVEELADRPGPDLLPDAVAVVDRLRREWVTSSG